jgi:DNA polymerase-3 subunit gamma/tau
MHLLANPNGDHDQEIRTLEPRFTLDSAMDQAERFADLDFRIRHGTVPQLPLEVAIVRAALARQREPSPLPAMAGPQEPTSPDPSAVNLTAPEVTETPVRSLSDRVRGPSAEQRAAPPALTKPVALHATPTPPTGPQAVTIDAVRALWDEIRANVKARSRRIDALLMSVDPFRVSGDTITLVSAYPFHRSKLEEPEVQRLIEDVISETLGFRVTVQTVLIGDVPGDEKSQEGRNGVRVSDREPAADRQESAMTDGDKRILDAAKNLFDAEEIEP